MLAAIEEPKTSRFGPPLSSGAVDRFSTGQALPEDLRSLIGETNLAHSVEDAVRQISAVTPGADRTPAWDILLGILTYSYASGMYLSDEIAASLNNNPSAAPLHRIAFANAEPSAVLRGFRRRNRRAVEQCLATVMHRGSRSGQSELELEADAKNRIARAIEADCWALDV